MAILGGAISRSLREESLEQLAYRDPLTGLLNRQGFEAALDAGIRRADERFGELACVFIDLDRFKWINDNFGHAVGDEVLRQVVSRVRANLRPEDTMSRIGGDEFAILIKRRENLLSASDLDLIADPKSNSIGTVARHPVPLFVIAVV